MIIKGYILETSEGGRFAKVRTTENEIITKVLMLHPYGETSNMASDKSSLVLLFFPLNSKTSAFGLPYNVLKQPDLASTEKAVGNFQTGNKITFKANGTNEVEGDTSIIASLYVDDEINTADSYQVQGTKVVGVQQAAIAAPSGGAVIDVQARAQLALLLTALKTHGLIAT